jgi:pyocin large subunit-like protein
MTGRPCGCDRRRDFSRAYGAGKFDAPYGDKLVYHLPSNTFGVMNAAGEPKTMFKPDPSKHGYPTNLDYFNAQ